MTPAVKNPQRMLYELLLAIVIGHLQLTFNAEEAIQNSIKKLVDTYPETFLVC